MTTSKSHKWHGGKGSAVRKTSDQNKYADNYDRIFGKKDVVDPHDSPNSSELHGVDTVIEISKDQQKK